MNSKKKANKSKFKVVFGYILLFSSLVLFTSFISYIFNWKIDQSNVDMIFDRDVEVENLLGKTGAYISHLFIYKLFGISSFILPIILFVSSYYILFNKKIFNKSKGDLKLLNSGDLKEIINIEISFATKNAIEKIEKLGGKIKLTKN